MEADVRRMFPEKLTGHRSRESWSMLVEKENHSIIQNQVDLQLVLPKICQPYKTICAKPIDLRTCMCHKNLHFSF